MVLTEAFLTPGELGFDLLPPVQLLAGPERHPRAIAASGRSCSMQTPGMRRRRGRQQGGNDGSAADADAASFGASPTFWCCRIIHFPEEEEDAAFWCCSYRAMSVSAQHRCLCSSAAAVFSPPRTRTRV
jgi:hypothetical protein